MRRLILVLLLAVFLLVGAKFRPNYCDFVLKSTQPESDWIVYSMNSVVEDFKLNDFAYWVNQELQMLHTNMSDIIHLDILLIDIDFMYVYADLIEADNTVYVKIEGEKFTYQIGR